MYFRYMLVAFLTNGLGAFGLRVLVGMGQAELYKLQYLAVWYLAGAALAAAAYLLRRTRPQSREMLVALAMGLCSLLGQLGMALALAGGVPGFVVFPVATGGGLLLVALAGVLIFRERITMWGYLGVAVGSAALALLSLP
ncbi:MAG: hypothetical protein KIT09_07565 [Bryobacteraceae bacterium]|nr:hypothetical protein [Bryobacteraceae bacterium]